MHAQPLTQNVDGDVRIVAHTLWTLQLYHTGLWGCMHENRQSAGRVEWRVCDLLNTHMFPLSLVFNNLHLTLAHPPHSSHTRNTHTQRHRQHRQTQTQTQTGRQTYRQTDTHAHTRTDRHTDTHTHLLLLLLRSPAISLRFTHFWVTFLRMWPFFNTHTH